MSASVALAFVIGLLVAGIPLVIALVHAHARRVESATELAAQREASKTAALQAKEDIDHLSETFSHLATKALSDNNALFMDLAKARLETAQQEATGELDLRQQAIEALVSPLQETIAKLSGAVDGLENRRKEDHSGLSEQIKMLKESGESLRSETHSLATALRNPAARGRWGELQLRRVVEMAGLQRYCDFVEQESVGTEGGSLRPDMVVRLPGGRSVVVDSKAPLDAYTRSIEAGDEATRKIALADHARNFKDHVKRLSAKAYWSQFPDSPDFVVAFVPGDHLLVAALEHDPDLMEYSVSNHVLLTTPMTLIALLRNFSYGWNQEILAENARHLRDLGQELYKRISTLGDHFSKLGRNLDSSVRSYNEVVASLESRVLPKAREFEKLGLEVGSIDQLEPVERLARVQRATEPVSMGEPSSDELIANSLVQLGPPEVGSGSPLPEPDLADDL